MRALVLLLMLLPQPFLHPLAAPPAQATQPALVMLQSPLPGQALQGMILITGNTAVEGFAACEISFGYTEDPTGTWFLIQRSTLPVENGLLTQWDTTTITDGDYTLRLMLIFTDGSQVTLTVPGLRVRNYSPIETDTPTPLPPSATPPPGTALPPSLTPTITPIPSATALPPTHTPLPTNPAIVSQADLLNTLGKGAGIGIGVLALLAMILGVQMAIRNRQ
jgi:hypothetical protein